ncbi:MAG: hypothetical protein IK026_03005 [Eubacteriaceae bacterium]|nr:hypothetical protein [Eubacteriaceae bacterium]MCR4723341.1 hypothetical protein [Eubacteriales bacterium]
MSWEELVQIACDGPAPLIATCVFCVACVITTFILVGKEIKNKEKEE